MVVSATAKIHFAFLHSILFGTSLYSLLLFVNFQLLKKLNIYIYI